MIPRRIKCTQDCQGTLDFDLEFVKLLQTDLSKQQYTTLNATSPGEDRQLPARLAICSHCILSICNIYLFTVLVLRAGFAF